MRKIKILTDSCSDLNQKLLEKYDIDYCKMNTVYENKETPASLTWDSYTPKQLYDIMRGGDRVKTTQVPAEEFMTKFKEYLDKEYDIIYIGCAIKQSGSVNTATVVAKQLMEEYPDAKIEAIDALNACIGEGMLAIRATELVQEGKSFEEVVETIKAARNTVNEFVTVQSLDSLRRAGRVKGSKAFFGNLMGVKPILIADADGEQTPIKKAKGRAGSLAEIVSLLSESIVNPEEQTIYLAHADCSESEIEMLKTMVTEKIKCKDIEVVYIGPIIGASVGPETIGLWAYGKEVTYRAVGEKQ